MSGRGEPDWGAVRRELVKTAHHAYRAERSLRRARWGLALVGLGAVLQLVALIGMAVAR
jgi:hypothetical protein